MADIEAQNDHEVLASGRFVLIRDIRKAMDGEDFLYFNPEGGKGILVRGFSVEDQNHYFEIFHRCQDFGLPHGQGWINELPWLIDFLKFMKYKYRIIESWKMNRG